MTTNAKDEARLETLLTVGRAVLTETLLKGKAESRFSACIRGWDRNHYILLELADGVSRKMVVKPKQECFFRFLAHGEVCAFMGTVLNMGSGAYSRIFRIAWPQHIKTIRLRHHDRLAIQTPCLIVCNRHPALTGELIDLSVGGCGLFVSEEFSEGDRIELFFDLPGGLSLEHLAAEVCRVRPVTEGFELGCAFHDISPEHQADVDYYVTVMLSHLREAENEDSPWALVIEPEPQRAAILQQALGAQGFDVLTARNAVYGMARLGNTIPRAIFVDIHQPGCSGVDICRIIRTAPQFETLPIFLYGEDGVIDNAIQESAKDAGVTECFSSIGVPDHMVQALSHLLD